MQLINHYSIGYIEIYYAEDDFLHFVLYRLLCIVNLEVVMLRPVNILSYFIKHTLMPFFSYC